MLTQVKCDLDVETQSARAHLSICNTATTVSVCVSLCDIEPYIWTDVVFVCLQLAVAVRREGMEVAGDIYTLVLLRQTGIRCVRLPWLHWAWNRLLVVTELHGLQEFSVIDTNKYQ